MDDKDEVEWRERVRRIYEALGEPTPDDDGEEGLLIGRDAIKAAWLRARGE